MYYRNRAEAGRQLAGLLEKYAHVDTVVVALSEGSAIVASQVAMALHTNLFLFLIKNIYLPGENEAIAGLSSAGTFTYNDMLSAGELEEMAGEYHQFIDQERIHANHDLNVLLAHDGAINKNFLRHRVVIVVSDGLSNGFSIHTVGEYLKTVAIKKLVIATPIASVTAVDRMHLIGDEIACLGVTPNFFHTNHYYEDNTIPSVEGVLKVMRNISINWKR
jgi:putative phosphoribosyl transferase